jgi:hypothetical protein
MKVEGPGTSGNSHVVTISLAFVSYGLVSRRHTNWQQPQGDGSLGFKALARTLMFMTKLSSEIVADFRALERSDDTWAGVLRSAVVVPC